MDTFDRNLDLGAPMRRKRNWWDTDLGYRDYGVMGYPTGYGYGGTPSGWGGYGYGPGLGAAGLDRWADVNLSQRGFVSGGAYTGRDPDLDRNIKDTRGEGFWRPRSDIFDDDANNLIIEFELPGTPAANISLNVTEDTITVRSAKPTTPKEREGFYYQSERHFGNFFRSLRLPEKVDPRRVTAFMDNGVLKVHISRSEAGGPSQRIDIQTGTRTETGGPRTRTTA